MSRRRYRFRYSEWQLGTWRSPFPVACGVSPRTFKCPLPESDAEFAVLSAIIFGVPLSMEEVWIPEGWDHGRATIAERYDDFAKVDGHFTSYDGKGYDRLGTFMRTVFGPMHCSASLTYTDFQRRSHRHWARLLRWQESRRRAQSSSLRPSFVRLADRFGVGENTASGNRPLADGVLSAGREDGAAAASMTGETP